MKHTPREWKVDSLRRITNERGNICIAQTFKEQEGFDGISRGEAEGNAKLIASAPRMYAALKAIASGERKDGKYDKYDGAGFVKIAQNAIEYVEKKEGLS